MRRKTMKRNIFLSNALMVLVVLVIFLLVNVAVIGLYTESFEREFKASIEQSMDREELEEMLMDFTLRKKEFIILFLVDGILCIVGLVVVSQFFTGKLVKYIMEPLDVLSDGAERIQNNDLTKEIEYTGDMEFENVCGAFNDMQKHILEEQEKNRKYEKARTDMIAGISHDLRTPLTAIRGTIKALLDGVANTPAQQEKFLQTAYRRTGDMDLLLNRLFYLSKLETGNMPISLQTIELAPFVERYAKERQALFPEEAGIEIAAQTKGVDAQAYVDPEELSRIFDNILENSRKYAGSNPLKIRITLARVRDIVSVCFADNGVGAPEEKLPYLFDEFYRGDASRGEKEGNGLGLYIVKYLAEAMGGSVRAENLEKETGGNGLAENLTEVNDPSGQGEEQGGFAVYIELPVENKEAD